MYQAIIWTNAYQIHQRIYDALGQNELKYMSQAPIWMSASSCTEGV